MRWLKLSLFNNAACHPGSAASQRRRLVGIVIAASMDHDGAAMHIGQLEPGGRYRCGSPSVDADGERRKVAPVAFAMGPSCFPVVSGS